MSRSAKLQRAEASQRTKISVAAGKTFRRPGPRMLDVAAELVQSGKLPLTRAQKETARQMWRARQRTAAAAARAPLSAKPTGRRLAVAPPDNPPMAEAAA